MDTALANLFPFITRKMLSFEHATRFQLRIRSQATRAESLNITGFTREGLFTFRHTTTTDRATNTDTFQIPDFPIWVSVSNRDLDAVQGEIFVNLSLLLDGNVIHELGAGNVYAQKSVAWPSANAIDTRPSGGFLGSVAGANPAAGVEASIVVPTGAVWRIQSVRVTLVAAAAAASRRVHLQMLSLNGDDILDAFSSVDQIISETKTYTFAPFGHIPDETDDNDILVNIPPNIYLEGDSSIQTATVNKNAGDDFGTMVVHREEWFSPT